MSTRLAVSVPARFPWNVRLLRTRSVLVTALVAFFLGLMGSAWLAFDLRYGDRVHPGVSVLGVSLGGVERTVARGLSSRLAAESGSRWLALRNGDRTWQTTLADLGIQISAEQTLEAALGHGRQGTLVQQARERWLAWRYGVALPPALVVSGERWGTVLSAIMAQVDAPARDARLVVERDARVWIEPGVEGRRVDGAATLEGVRRALTTGYPRDLALVVERVPRSINAADWESARAAATVMLRAPVVLTFESRRWELAPVELAAAIVPGIPQGGGGEPRISLDRRTLRSLVARVAPEVNVAPRNAVLEMQNGQVAIVRGTVGRAVDVDATVEALERAMRRDRDRTASVVAREQMPALTSQDLVAIKQRWERALAQPLVIAYEKRRWTLSPASLAGMATFVEVERQGRPDVQLRLDPKKVAGALKPIASAVNRPARNARFDLRGNTLVAIQAAQPGQEVHVGAMAQAMTAALHEDERTVSLLLAETLPDITEADGPKLIGRDLVMDASTVYAAGLPARIHNIQLAAERLNGAVVPPGGVYSFNDTIGPTTLSSGFKVGYGIIMKNGQPETVPSDAGGICQVATTLFQAVFWAGYKVEERNWHFYWISRYGQPPRGRQGLDATVDDSYGVDFQFRNNTPDWLLVQAKTDGKNLTFRLYGTKPAWDVRVEGPTITKVVKADPKLVYQEDPAMPPGQRIQIEAAADGFTARFLRTVVQDGQVIDRWVAQSSYVPARNVVLVGPGTPTEDAEQ